MDIWYPAMAVSTMSNRQVSELPPLLKSSRAWSILGSSSMSTRPSPSQSWSLQRKVKQIPVEETNYRNIHLSWPERVPRVARFSVASITCLSSCPSYWANILLTSLNPKNEDQPPSFFVSWNNLNILSILFLMLMSSLNSSSIWRVTLASNFVLRISTYWTENIIQL